MMHASRVAKAAQPRCMAFKPVQNVTRHHVRAYAAAVKDEVIEVAQEKVVEHDGPDVGLDSQQVSTLLNMICQDTEIAEMHLQMGKFELKIKRNVSSSASPAAPAYAPAPASAAPTSAPAAPYNSTMTLTLEDSVDESLMYVTSPKVGIFRRGKYAGGKRIGKANCVEVGDQVKKGQVIAFVDQLGTHVAIESPQAGEISKFMLEDGAPVEYKQEVVEMLPFFGGPTAHI